jgi:hypothetical protein
VHAGQDVVRLLAVGQVAVVQDAGARPAVGILVEVVDAVDVHAGGAAHDAVHLVALLASRNSAR